MYNDYLMHHGILGMKWGVRRYQKKDGRLTSLGKKRYGYSDKKDKKEEKKHKGLTPKQKKILKVGAAVAVTLLGTYALYKMSTVKQMSNPLFDNDYEYDPFNGSFTKKVDLFQEPKKMSKKQLVKEFKNSEVDSKFSLLKKQKKFSVDEDLAAINTYNLDDQKTMQNCGLCTTAYELRRRGYDVQANYSKTGRSSKTLANFFKNAKVQTDADIANEIVKTIPKNPTSADLTKAQDKWISKITKKIESMGEGARGNFIGMYPLGGGHSIIFEVENGKAVFRDGQTGRTYASAKKALQNFSCGKSEFFRTDNLEINPDTIKSAVTNRGTARKVANFMEEDPELANYFRKDIIEFAKANNVSLSRAREFYKEHYLS